MKKFNNRGVSLIEILIAVVIFVICITPIINQLATGIRIGQKADDQQAATDYGRSLAESLKQIDIANAIDLEKGTYNQADLAELFQLEEDSMDVTCTFSSVKADGSTGVFIPNGSYVISTGVKDPGYELINVGTGVGYTSVTAMYQELKLKNKTAADDAQEALVRQYTIKGESTKVDYRKYDIVINLDTKPYAINSLVKADYVDPNAINLGNLSSLDTKKTAVITAASNYDSIASASFFNSALSALENSGSEADKELAVQIKNGVKTIESRATKSIQLILDPISGDPNGYMYKVTCKTIYDNPGLVSYEVNLEDTRLEYTAFEQRFETFPEIYLMYNQFLYLSAYGDDTITIENNVDDREAKIYVIRTAATNDSVKDIADVGSGKLLPDANYGRDIIDAGEFLYMTKFELKNSLSAYPVKIFTNIDLERDDGGTPVSNISSSLESPGNRACKMSINVAAAQLKNVVRPLDEDERYSEAGRVYNILIELTNKDKDTVTTFDTSKGDY